MQKSQKKKKEKKFLWDVFPCGFPISGDKKGGKSKWCCFFPYTERENVKLILKKKKNFFFSFRELFHHFSSLLCRKR